VKRGRVDQMLLAPLSPSGKADSPTVTSPCRVSIRNHGATLPELERVQHAAPALPPELRMTNVSEPPVAHAR
jgi:hypothetical protein